MTNLEINQALGPVYNALNNLSVSGKNNVRNLAASLEVLEEILVTTAKEIQDEADKQEGK